MASMRTGAEYRASLRDGRRIWIMGEGRVSVNGATVRELPGGAPWTSSQANTDSTARLLPSAPSHLRASDVVFAHNRFDPFSSDNRVLETVPSLRSLRRRRYE